MIIPPRRAWTSLESLVQCWTIVVGPNVRQRDLAPADHSRPDRVDDVLDAFDEGVILLLGDAGDTSSPPNWKYGVGAAAAISRTTSADEPVHAVARRAERVRRTADARERLGRRAIAAEIRIRQQRGVAVSRHVDLRHDRDVARLRIGDDVGVLLLRVEAAGPAADLRLSADRGEVRPRLDLDAPPLIVGEMQVQPVDLV